MHGQISFEAGFLDTNWLYSTGKAHNTMRRALGLVGVAFSLSATGTAAAAGDVKTACLAFVGAAFCVIAAFWPGRKTPGGD